MGKLSQLPLTTTPLSTDYIPTTSNPATTPIDSNMTLQTLQNTIANATYMANYVVSGLVWSQSAGLVGTMTAGKVVINGFLVNVSSIGTFSFTASKDYYIDVDNTGTVNYTAVSNGATSGMPLAANSVRIAKVVTGASAITAIYQIPQQYNTTNTASLWTGFDPLGNRVYGVTPYPKMLGIVTQNQSVTATISSTPAQITNSMSLTFIANGYNQVQIEYYFADAYWTNGANLGVPFIDFSIYDTTLANHIGLASWEAGLSGNSDHAFSVKAIYTPAAGTHTVQLWGFISSGTITLNQAGGRRNWSPNMLIARVVD